MTPADWALLVVLALVVALFLSAVHMAAIDRDREWNQHVTQALTTTQEIQ